MFSLAGKSADRLPLPSFTEPGPAGSRPDDLLEQIGSFLTEHSLAINAGNLALAHGIFSGRNARLGRHISQRQLANEPVTQAWLDQMATQDTPGADHGKHNGRDHDGGDHGGREELDRLIGTLDQSLQHFWLHANAASKTATHHHCTLADTASRLEAGLVDPTALAQLTRTLAESTRQVAEDMRRSEVQAQSLRDSLDQARRDTDIDQLTGLANRRAFETLLENEYRAARETAEPLSIAFCDIDNFKAINDTHGHDAGDRVIRAIARVLQRIADPNCHVARHGGEEFVLLFRGLTTDQVHAKLDTARASFASRKLVDRKTEMPIGNVSFSGGIADVLDYENPRAALQAADEALCRAKEQGRNRIVMAGAANAATALPMLTLAPRD